MIKTLAVLGCVLVGVTGCGADQGKPQPSQQVSTEVKPTPSTSIMATNNTPLTREEAAAKYLELVKPVNAQRDAYDKVTAKYETGYESEAKMLKEIRAAAKKCMDADRIFITGLEKTHWPLDAVEDVKDLILVNEARQLSWSQLTKAESYGDVLDVKFPKNTASQLVRARLGLPRVGD